jgi:hypothetical protein
MYTLQQGCFPVCWGGPYHTHQLPALVSFPFTAAHPWHLLSSLSQPPPPHSHTHLQHLFAGQVLYDALGKGGELVAHHHDGAVHSLPLHLLRDVLGTEGPGAGQTEEVLVGQTRCGGCCMGGGGYGSGEEVGSACMG